MMLAAATMAVGVILALTTPFTVPPLVRLIDRFF